MAAINLGQHGFGYDYQEDDDDGTYADDFFDDDDDDGDDNNGEEEDGDDVVDGEEDEAEEEIGLYHCHQCNSDVRPPSLSPLLCPICYGGFLEECRESRPSLSESMHDYLGGIAQIFDDISTLLSRTEVSSRRNPFSYLQNRMQSIFNIPSDDEDDEWFVSENVRPARTSSRFGPQQDRVSQNELRMRSAFDNDDLINLRNPQPVQFRSRFRQQGQVSLNDRQSSSAFQQHNHVSLSDHQSSSSSRQQDHVSQTEHQSRSGFRHASQTEHRSSSGLQQQDHAVQTEQRSSSGFQQQDQSLQIEHRSRSRFQQQDHALQTEHLSSSGFQQQEPVPLNDHRLSSGFQHQAPQTEHRSISGFQQQNRAQQNDHQSNSAYQQQNPAPQNNPRQITPASVSAVKQLPTLLISQQDLNINVSAMCAICKDEFLLHVEVKQMPCKHVYHPRCILPWLAEHNSCPVCRYLLPTDSNPQHIHPTTSQGTSSNTNASIRDSQGSQNRIHAETHRGSSNSMNRASGRTQQGQLNSTHHGSNAMASRGILQQQLMNCAASSSTDGERLDQVIPNANTMGCPTCPNISDAIASRQIPWSWPGSSSNEEIVEQYRVPSRPIRNDSVCCSPHAAMARVPQVCNNRPAYIPTDDAVVQRPFPTAPPLSDILPSSSNSTSPMRQPLT